jgi:hypothetical protein
MIDKTMQFMIFRQFLIIRRTILNGQNMWNQLQEDLFSTMQQGVALRMHSMNALLGRIHHAQIENRLGTDANVDPTGDFGGRDKRVIENSTWPTIR